MPWQRRGEVEEKMEREPEPRDREEKRGKNKCGGRINTEDGNNAAVHMPAVVKSHRRKGHTFPFFFKSYLGGCDLSDLFL